MKAKQKRLLILAILFIVLSCFGPVAVWAEEEAIPSIDVEVLLHSDGSAVITETWKVRGVSGGTEYYKALHNMEGMSVHSLRVWDETGEQYTTLPQWDTQRSREEKARTCGILQTEEGYELCWGIGSYGDHSYRIQYTLDGLVKDYGDYAGFYHQFISQLSSAPESVALRIRAADAFLMENNARIWGYGFTGEVDIAGDGSLAVFSSEALGSGDYVNVLCRFDRSLFPLAAAAGTSFEQLRESADQENSNTLLYVILAVLAVVIALSVFGITFFYSRYKLADGTAVRLPKRKEIQPDRSLPYGGSIPAVYCAMQLLRIGIPHEQLLGTYLIRWQKAGHIRLGEREREPGARKEQKEESIIFLDKETSGSGAEQALYEILRGEADREGILWISDLEKRADKLYQGLTAWAGAVKDVGAAELVRLGAAATDGKGKLRFTESGFAQAVQMLGFQQYLSAMHKEGAGRDSKARWEDYLVFAVLFNVGEQVLKSMKELDPVYFDSFSTMYGYNAYSMMHLLLITGRISETTTPDSGGTGGAAGSAGGGGFSGGGGGGSR